MNEAIATFPQPPTTNPMDKKNLKRLLVGDFSFKRLLRSVLFIYLSVGVYGYFFSEGTIFQPQPPSYQDTDEILKLTSGNGVRISAVYLSNPQATYTILYSHGNAEDLGDVLPAIQQIRQIGFAVLAYDYQGYGTSEGFPSESNAYGDINAAYAYLTEKLGIPPSRIILYGRSVGGGLAVDLASRQPVAGLVLESTFTSVFRTITHIPLYPVDKFDNISKIEQVNVPVLVIHGTDDEVIALWHGQQLFAAADRPKQSLWVEGATHNDVMWVAGDRYAEALREFLVAIDTQSRTDYPD